MKYRRSKYLILAVAGLLAASCSKVPSYVIQPDEMAELMADIHVGESVIDMNRLDYRDDSTKMLFKQSILAAHGVTQNDLDTSMDWYSHNISHYMDVYDKTIEILERRISETGNRIAAENISVAGDSVNVWSAAAMVAVSSLSPTGFITFSLQKDENWERGDSYTWRAKFANSPQESVWGIMADYADGSTEFITADIEGDGWREISFVADSTKEARRVYGYLNASARPGATLWADSIMLIRNRLQPDKYRRRYQQLKMKPVNLTEGPNDSTEANESTGS